MRLAKRGAVVVATTAAFVALTPAVAALATTKSEDGGTWTYAATGTTNYSYYYHPSKEHRSSVQNDPYGLVRSANEPGGIQARASEGVALSGNHAYWDVLS